MNLEEYIKHIKSICKQGILRHKNIILDETFQKESLEIIKCYEQLQQENKELQQENEKNKHYKTLYQSLKKQKEELRSWLVEQEEKSWDEVSSTFSYVLDKLEELEDVFKN